MLAGIEALQLGLAPTRVFAVDLDQARNEELLLLVRLGLPVVLLSDVDDEAGAASPLSLLWFDGRGGEGFDGGQVVEVPGLANGEGAVGVLLGLVHAHAAGLAHGDDDDAGLLRVPSALRRRRAGRMRPVLGDANVGDVRLHD